MTDRDQSPHYIPELDPENKKRPSDFGERFFVWIQYLIFAIFGLATATSAFAWIMEWDYIMHMSLAVAIGAGIATVLTFIG